MKECFEYENKRWDWKAQFIWEWDNQTPISTLINRIESKYYQTKELELNLNCIDLTSYLFKTEDLFDFISHYNLVLNSDLSYPIIINKKWHIIDWRHRLCKAIIEWKETIKAIIIIDADVI